MKKSGFVGALALSFALGFLIAYLGPWNGSIAEVESAGSASVSSVTGAASDFALPIAAQEAWFPPISDYDTDGEGLEDRKFDALLATLKERLEAEETLADFEREANIYLHEFTRRIMIPELTPEQTARASDYFTHLAQQRPENRDFVEKQQLSLEHFAKAGEGVPPFAIVESWFPKPDPYSTTGQRFFADAVVDELLDVLDAVLAMPATTADFGREAKWHLGVFGIKLRMGSRSLTEAQTARVSAYLNDLKAEHPDSSQVIEPHLYELANLVPGRVAPNIVGNDLDGIEFELQEYRGEIVALYFSGHWCGPCREEYPYQRFMLELFDDQPVTILGVNSDEELAAAREAKEEERLDYRVWWDGQGEEPTRGPIAAAWNIVGWPTIYILDDQGVIRYVNKKQAEVISAVNELLIEKSLREAQASAAGA